jgi:hypothetical protein
MSPDVAPGTDHEYGDLGYPGIKWAEAAETHAECEPRFRPADTPKEREGT